MGMNLDSGELLAVKQVCLPAKGASNAKTQAHIKELEDEVKLLKNLSHPNIVRYLGTARDAEALNILLEFVPGGSIHSLLEKFDSFPESVIREYTKKLLLGLEYLHKNGITHRDVKGANILVDNKACIKLADFGASKQVVELATIGAKSMKGTPFWMAPEVIRQTGHSFSADIWSVGCTVIEMATGKPPWVDQHQEACMAAALYHIGSAQTPPPIPESLSAEAKDFLLKCFLMEPNSRPSASELLQHPFVTGEYRESHSVFHPSAKGSAGRHTLISDHESLNHGMRTISGGLKGFCNFDSIDCCKSPQRASNWDSNSADDDMCQVDDDFSINSCKKLNPPISPLVDLNKSFNPMCEPNDDWPCKFDERPEGEKTISSIPASGFYGASKSSCNISSDFTFPNEPLGDEDDEVTESKIRAFLDEKALDLKKLQTPLYEFYNTLNTPPTSTIADADCTNVSSNLPTRSPSPHRAPSRRLSTAIDAVRTASPGSNNNQISDGKVSEETLKEIPEWKEVLDAREQGSLRSSSSFSERRRKWKEELDEELKRQREMMRQARRGR